MENIFLCILLCMIFLHIFDDFVLQTFMLSKLKQKKTWERYCDGKPSYLSELYHYDYLVALYLHGLSWAICIVLPWIFLYGSKLGNVIVITVIINSIIHAWIDNEKANKEAISLILDQVLHMLQVFVTWIILYACYIYFSI